MKKVALVTGASSGIGLDVSLALLKKEYMVYGAARRTELMKPIEDNGGKIVYLDLCDSDSIKKCVETIVSEEGKIDVLVNNAGFGLGGSIEDIPVEEAKKQFDVNVFGLSQMIQGVLPFMRKEHSGKIINISSVAGRFSTPFSGWYHATKYCVEALSDALRMEVKNFGIKVVIIEPGMIQTDWGIIHGKNIRRFSGETAYKENACNAAKFYEKSYVDSKKLSRPGVITDLILKAVSKKNPKARYSAGTNSGFYLFCARFLPAKLFDFTTCMFMNQK